MLHVEHSLNHPVRAGIGTVPPPDPGNLSIMQPIRVRGVGLEAKGDHLVASFTLSATPGQRWIDYFRDRGSSCVLGIATADFRRNRIYVELPRHEELETLIRSVEAIIEGREPRCAVQDGATASVEQTGVTSRSQATQ